MRKNVDPAFIAACLAIVVFLSGCALDGGPRGAESGFDQRVEELLGQGAATHDVEGALVQSRQALVVAREGGSPRALIRALLANGRLEAKVARYDRALSLLEEAAQTAKAVDDVAQEAEAYISESSILCGVGLYDWADERLRRGLHRLDGRGHEDLGAHLWISRAVAAREQDRFDDSLAMLRRASELLPERHPIQSAILANRGHTLLAAARPGHALAALDAARPAMVQTGEARRIAEIDSSRGRALSSLGRHEEAVAAVRHAYRALEEERQPVAMTETLLDFGKVLVAAGREEEAEQTFELAMTLAQRLDTAVLMEEALVGLSRWRARDSAQGLEHVEALATVRQRRLEEQGMQRLQSLQSLFEADVRELRVVSAHGLHHRFGTGVWALAAFLTLGLAFGGVRAECRSRALRRRLRSTHEALAQAHEREEDHRSRSSIVERTAAAFAFELRQPLTAILTNAQVAQRALLDLDQKEALIAGTVEDTVEAARRAQDIVCRLRGLMSAEAESADEDEVCLRRIEDLVSQEIQAGSRPRDPDRR